MTLVDFLIARLADDEAVIATDSRDRDAFGPARMQAECDAKRRIVNASLIYHEGDRDPNPDDPDDPGGGWALSLALLALAEVYADHPDYRPEWKR